MNLFTNRKSPAITSFSIEPVGTTNDAIKRPLITITISSELMIVLIHEITVSVAEAGFSFVAASRPFVPYWGVLRSLFVDRFATGVLFTLFSCSRCSARTRPTTLALTISWPYRTYHAYHTYRSYQTPPHQAPPPVILTLYSLPFTLSSRFHRKHRQKGLLRDLDAADLLHSALA